VYKDVVSQAKIFQNFFSTPEFTFHEYVNVPIVYRDMKTRVTLKCAKSRIFNSYSIELLQLVEGTHNLYHDFLLENREGFHHVDIIVNNIDAWVDFFKQKGIDVIQKGKSLRKWAYLDTETLLGFINELVDVPLPKRKKI
jgi:hypothetical protein